LGANQTEKRSKNLMVVGEAVYPHPRKEKESLKVGKTVNTVRRTLAGEKKRNGAHYQ